MNVQRTLTCCIHSNKLPEKPHISGVELPDLADAILHHGDALDAHAEGEAGDLLGVVGGLLFRGKGKDRRVHHAAAEQFDPTRLLAFAATLSATKDATDRSEERRVGKECRSRWS